MNPSGDLWYYDLRDVERYIEVPESRLSACGRYVQLTDREVSVAMDRAGVDELDCFSTPPEPGEPRPGGKLNGLIRAARDARTRERRERARIDALPPELRVIEMRRAQAEWEECKRRQRAEAKRRRELMADMREINGKPRKLPPRYF